MKCSKCQTKLNLVEQVKEWEDLYGEDAIITPDFPIMINLICEKCESSVAVIYIEATVEEEKVKGFGGIKVNVPLTEINNKEQPMGVSAWKEYGKKYGYWDYFKE